MRTQTKLSTLVIALVLSGIFFSLAFAGRLIPKEIPELFLTGTMEKESSFNLVLDPGSSHQDSITIVNNSDKTLSYNVRPVDSERNNQNDIVFKMANAENLNLGKWVNLGKSTFEIPAHGNLNIPFSINVPGNTFPGTYYGGISIEKNTPAFISTASQSVKVNTRNVMQMIINVPGEVSKDYEISNLTYSKGAFHYSFKNKGNVIMTVAGEVQISGTGFGGQTGNIKVPPLKVLPGDSLEETIAFKNQPILGSYHATFAGKVYYFDGMENKDLELNSFKLETDFAAINFQFLVIVISLLVLLIAILIIKHLLKKKYLSECSEYIVADGENIRTIATKFNMSWKKLAKINRIGEPYSLDKGQKILVHNAKK